MSEWSFSLVDPSQPQDPEVTLCDETGGLLYLSEKREDGREERVYFTIAQARAMMAKVDVWYPEEDAGLALAA